MFHFKMNSFESPAEKHEKKISILLTRLPDVGSSVISLLTLCYYTHASIGLQEDHNTYYTFVSKGFRVEKLTRYIRPEWEPVPCVLYEIPVSEETYSRLEKIIRSFEEKKQSLQYAKLGVVLGLMQIRHKLKDQYFCSQFVAEVLRESRAAQLCKDPSLYMPKDLRRLPHKRLTFQGTLPDFAKSYGLA